MNTLEAEAPRCSLCGGPLEEWPHGGGWGNNPEPLATVEERCCDECNQTKVIPARLLEFEVGKNIGRDF